MPVSYYWKKLELEVFHVACAACKMVFKVFSIFSAQLFPADFF